jgi:OOP family OmpA-OmpF porin
MKKYAFVLTGLMAATAAQAQFYGTVAGGASQINLDCAGTTSCDNKGTGFKLVGGYEFGNGFSLEAGYVSFGKFNAAVDGIGLTAKPTAFLLGGAFALPFNESWGLNARLGVAQVKTKIDARVGAASGSTSDSNAKAYAGLGLTYALSKTVKFELGVDSTQAEFEGEKGTVRLVSLGATFAF